MANRPGLFRAEALEKLRSPEGLDALVAVALPAHWLGFLALALLSALALGWGVLGWIPERVAGEAVLLSPGAVHAVRAEAGGRITRVAVSPGQAVGRGDVIAEIAHPDLALQAAWPDSRARLLQEIARRDLGLGAPAPLGDEALDAALAAERDAILALSLAPESEALDRRLAVYGELLLQRERRRGPSSASALLSALTPATAITSPVDGTILEVVAREGGLVASGERLATLQGASGEPLRALAFLGAGEGTRVQPGMPALLTVASAPRTQYGAIRATVRSVSPFPVSPERVAAAVGHAQIGEQLTAGGRLIAVEVDLEPDPSTPTGLAWTASSGPAFALAPGTTGTLAITVEGRRPVTYVLPFLRSLLGG